MRSWALKFLCVLVCCGSSPVLAQQQAGPRTLQGLVQAGETINQSTDSESDAPTAGPKRPTGTCVRPRDGVQHPDLDRAWADYDAAVTNAADGLLAAINEQFDAAAAKGDLDAAEIWQARLENFEKNGEWSADLLTKSALAPAVATFKQAKDELTKAYESLVKDLTMQKKIAQAKIVRNEMRNLSPLSAQPVRPTPVTLLQFQDSLGKTLSFEVVGAANGGSVWGSNPYTADSALAKAAVHAGVLQPGEAGQVKVTILPGQQSYTGSMRSGVTTSSWGAFPLSYRIEGAREAQAAPTPVTLSQFRNSLGKTLSFEVVGAANGGSVWGSNPYTADSALAKAAVHAGVLQPGEVGQVKVTILPGQQSYTGSMRSGVTTSSWGAFPLSYRIEHDQ
jgi:hypothetical protein